jgi:hypothetical protein
MKRSTDYADLMSYRLIRLVGFPLARQSRNPEDIEQKIAKDTKELGFSFLGDLGGLLWLDRVIPVP